LFNKWTCDCRLLPLKSDILQYPTKFEDKIICRTPYHFDHQPVRKADFCTSTTLPTKLTTTPTTTSYQPISTSQPTQQTDITSGTFSETSTNSTSTETTTEAYLESTTESHMNQFSLSCYISNRTDDEIRQQNQSIRIKDRPNGDISIYLNVLHEHSSFIWFLMSQKSSVRLRCSVGDRARIVMNDLMDDSVYKFCITDGVKEIVSPFNCVSYYTGQRKSYVRPWYIQSKVILIIGLICMTCSLSILGVIVLSRKINYGFILHRNKKLASKHVASITSPFNEALNNTYGTIEVTKGFNP